MEETSSNIYETSTGVAKFDSQKDAKQYIDTRLRLDSYDRLMNLVNNTPNAPADFYVAASQLDSVDDEAFQKLVSQTKNAALAATIEEEDNQLLRITNSIFSGFKGISRIGLGTLDSIAQGTTKLASVSLKSSVNEEGKINWATPFKFILNVGDAYWNDYETYVKGTQMGYALDKLARTGDWEAAFGEEAMGSGFIINQQGEIATESEEFWKNYWTLNNGDGMTIGRLTADSFGFEKGSTPYDIGSGIIDGLAMILIDPTNLIPFGAIGKLGKASKVIPASDAAAVAKIDSITKTNIKLSDGNIIEFPKIADNEIPSFLKLDETAPKGQQIYILDDTIEMSPEDLTSVNGRLFDVMLNDPDKFQEMWTKIEAYRINFQNQEDYLTFAREALEASDISHAYQKVQREVLKNSEETLQQVDELEAIAATMVDEINALQKKRYAGTGIPTAPKQPTVFNFRETDSVYGVSDELALDTPVATLDDAVNALANKVSLESGYAPLIIKEGTEGADEAIATSDNYLFVKKDGNIEAVYNKDGFQFKKTFTKEAEEARLTTTEPMFPATVSATDEVAEPKLAATVEPQQLDELEEARLQELELAYDIALQQIDQLKFGMNISLDEINTLRKQAGSKVASKIEELKKKREEKLNGLDAEQRNSEVFKENLQAYVGMSADQNTIKSTAYFMGLLGDKFDVFLDAIIYFDSPAKLKSFLPKLNASSLKLLANTTTKEEALAALSKIHAQGDWSNAATRSLMWSAKMGKTANAVSSNLNDVANVKNLRLVQLGANTNTPPVYSVSSENVDDMVNLTSSSILYVARVFRFKNYKDSKRILDFHDRVVDEMIYATNSAERKRIYINTVREIITEFIPEWKELPPQVQKEFLDMFNSNIGNVNDTIYRNARMQSYADLGDDIDPNINMILFEDQLNFNVSAIDWEKLRKYVSYGVKLSKDDTLKGLPRRDKFYTFYTDLFDGFLKPALLFARPGYIAYNMTVSQTTMGTHGMPTIFNHPIHVLGLAQAVRGKEFPLIGKWLNRFNYEGVGADGKKLVDPEVDEDFRVLFNAERRKSPLGRIRALNFGRLDSMSEILISKNNKARKIHAGEVRVFESDPEFAEAVAENSSMFFSAGMHQNVLQILTGKSPEWLVKYAKQKNLSIEDALTEYYFSGNGRKVIDNIIDANWGDKPDVLRTEKIDGIPNFSSREGIKEYLFGESRYSVAKLVGNYTNDLDGEIIESIILYLNRQEEILKTVNKSLNTKINETISIPKELKKLKLPNNKEIDMANEHEFYKELGEMFKASWKNPNKPTKKPNVATKANYVEVEQMSGVKKASAKLMGGFFKLAGKIESDFSYSPAFYLSYWEGVSQRVFLLNKKDAEKVLELAEKELSSIPGSFAKRTLKDIRKNVKEAAGNGGYTIDDINIAGNNFAVNKQGDMFYESWKRNQLGYAVRLGIPFAQAGANGYKVYAKAFTQFPKKAYKLQKLYVGAQETGSNTVYETLGLDYDPSQGFIWQDEYTGEQYISVPLLGYAYKALGREEGPRGQLDVRLQSWNPVNAGEYLPGIGQAITIPYSVIDARFPNVTKIIPEDFERTLFPYMQRNMNKEQFSLFSTSWQQIGETFGFGDLHWRKDVSPVMANLMYEQPEKYTEIDEATGLPKLTEGGKERLVEDAKMIARRMQAGKALHSMILRSHKKPNYTVDTNGDIISASAMVEEYQEAFEESGNRGQALYDMIQKYGMHNVFLFISPSEYLNTATTEGMTFVNNNMEFAQEINNVVGLFFDPKDATEASVNFGRWQSSLGKGEFKDPEDIAKSFNDMLLLARISVIDSRRNLDPSHPGYLTKPEADSLKQSLRSMSSDIEKEVTVNWVESRIVQLQKGLTNEELANTPAGIVATKYFQLRNLALQDVDGTSLGGKKDAETRQKLKNFGNKMSEDVPEFKSMWENVLLKELEYYDGRE